MARERSWQLVGGHLALDLCNTVAWRLDPARRVDRIATPAEFDSWFEAASGAAAGAAAKAAARAELGPGHTPPTRGEHVSGAPRLRSEDALLLQVHNLRDALSEVLEGAGNPEALRSVVAAWHRAIAVAEPGPALPVRFTIEPRVPTDVLHLLALAAGELLQDQAIGRLRRCEGQGCGWFFLDTTRNHSRRWCAPDDCGNRERVRAYGRRQRGAGT
jgi:predicted RNA-binding Zn ribbon-like protein